MIDQYIYKELGQYLYNIAPNAEENINAFYIRRNESDLETRMWMGDSYQGQKTIGIRRSVNEIDWNLKLVNDLHKFFQQNNWGDWNMFHFKVFVKESQYRTYFERDKTVAEGGFLDWDWILKKDFSDRVL